MTQKEVDLTKKDLPKKDPSDYREQPGPDLSREPLLEQIIRRVENKERVFVKFLDNHERRPGAIALVKKIDGRGAGEEDRFRRYGDGTSDYTFHLKWDDRKNTTKFRVNYEKEIVYLPNYTGETFWFMFDPKEYAKEHGEPVEDRLGNELKVDDVVIYVNARYGSGANIDFGVVREIKRKGVRNSYRKITYVDTTVIIESIAVNEDDGPLMSKITKPERIVMKITDVDLMNEALVLKLIQ